jgi:hypothetical protein
MNGFPFLFQYFLGVPKDTQLVRCEIPLFEDRRLGIAALAVRHRMQGHPGRRLQHHECAAAVADLAAALLDRHPGAADATLAFADEPMAPCCRAHGPGARHCGQLERHAHRREARRRIQVCPDRGAEREIRQHGERADVTFARFV